MRTHGQEPEKSSVSATALISSKIEFAQALQSLHHYITIPHITSHANTHTLFWFQRSTSYLHFHQFPNSFLFGSKFPLVVSLALNLIKKASFGSFLIFAFEKANKGLTTSLYIKT